MAALPSSGARVFLADFGLARDTATGSRLTRTGVALGTPAYMSPEQARGEGTLAPASDCWALGSVLYECLAGRRAFGDDQPAAIVGRLVAGRPPALAGVPRGVAGLLAACWRGRAAARPADGAALGRACQRVLAGRPPGLGHDAPRRWVLASLAVPALGVAVWGAWPAPPVAPAPGPSADDLAAQARTHRHDDPARAAALLAQALRTAPGRHDLAVELGLVRWLAADDAGAIAAWASIPPAVPEGTRARWLAGLAAMERLYSLGDQSARPAATAAWTEASAGSGAEARWASAGLLVLGSRLEEARRILADADAWDAWYLRGLVEQHADATQAPVDVAAGGEAIRRALESGLTLAGARLTMGILQMRANHVADAERNFAELTRLRPGWAIAWMNLATARSGLGDIAGAGTAADEALRLDGTMAPAYVLRGKLWVDRGDLPRALAEFELAVAHAPRDARARFNRGSMRAALGDDAGALADMDHTLMLDPTLAEAFVLRGNLRRSAAPRDALADYEAAVRARPDYAIAHGNRGAALLSLGDVAAAAEAYERALRLDPDLADAHQGLGAVRIAQGDPAAAVASFRRFLELAPAHRRAAAVREWLAQHGDAGDRTR